MFSIIKQLLESHSCGFCYCCCKYFCFFIHNATVGNGLAGGLAPDIARGRTIEAFLRVAKNHKLTPAEKKAFVTAAAAIDGDITLSEAEMINAMDTQ